MEFNIEGYSDVEQVAKGGFGVVYRARQDRFNRTVAVKVLTVEDLDDRERVRFERECSAMGNLSWHPNVVAVFDSGIAADGHPFLTMEFLDAGSLADRIVRTGPLSWQDAVATGVQVSGALGAAHDAGTLHRDLKPENLLVGPFGEVKLGDFGIAAVEEAARTTVGHAAFTVAHVAPEVLRGQRPDVRTDVYGLASTIFTLIDGQPPFIGEEEEPIAAVITRVLNVDAPGLSGVPQGLDELLRQALHKDPDRRPATAEEFGRALQQVQADNGEPVTDLRLAPTTSAETSTGSTPATTSGRRRQAPRGDANATVVGGVAGAAALAGEGVAAADQPTGSVPVRRTVPEVAVPPVPAPATGAGDGAGSTDGSGRSRTGLVIAVGLVLVLLVAGGVFLATSGGDDPPADTATATTVAAAEVSATITVGAIPLGVAVTNDAVWVTNSGDGTVSRIDPATDEVVETIQVGENPVNVAATDDAVWVANNGSGTLSQIDPATNEVVETVDVGAKPFGLAVTSEALWVSSDATTSVLRLDPATNAVVATIEVDDNPFGLAATEEFVWVTSDAGGGVGQAEQGSILQIDTATNTTGPVLVVGQNLGSVTADDTSAWLANSDEDTVVRIEAATAAEDGRVVVGATPEGLAVDGDVVWVANSDDGSVTMLDRVTNDVIDTVTVGDTPLSVAAGDGTAWVVDPAAGTVTRIDRAAG